MIADTDEFYLKQLTRYMITHFGHQFRINQFTKKDFFEAFLEKDENAYDLVLMSPEFYEEGMHFGYNKLYCILSDGTFKHKNDNFHILDKYKPAREIVQTLLMLYSEQFQIDLNMEKDKHTQVIAVYSPQSGSGKTSLSMAMCQWLKRAGKSVLYLNLEENASTGLFFDTAGEKDLSHILFYLKAKIENIHTKIKAIKKDDFETGVEYFIPPKSNLELEEVTASEYCALIQCLKKMSAWDVIFIDLSSGFNHKILSMFLEADQILWPLFSSPFLTVKVEGVLKDFEILLEREGIDLRQRCILVENQIHAPQANSQANPQAENAGDFVHVSNENGTISKGSKSNEQEERRHEEIQTLGGMNVIATIPHMESFWVQVGDKLQITQDEAYTKEIEKIWRFMRQDIGFHD